MAEIKTYSMKKDSDTNLQPNFKVKEFACKDGSDTVLVAIELAWYLQMARNHFQRPVIINSGYRTVEYNKKIGGAASSQHTLGTAADIAVQGVAPLLVCQFFEHMYTLYQSGKGGIALYPSFAHVDVRSTWYRGDWTSGRDVPVPDGFPGFDSGTKINLFIGTKTTIDAENEDGAWVAILPDGTRIRVRELLKVLGYSNVSWFGDSNTILVEK